MTIDGVYEPFPDDQVIPESAWLDYVFANLSGREHILKPARTSQGNQPQCLATVVSAAVERMRALRGFVPQDLSAADLYSRVPADVRGSSLGYVIDEARLRGIGLTSISGEVLGKTTIPSPDEVRMRFKSSWYNCELDFQKGYSAVCRMWPTAIVMDWAIGYKYVDGAEWLVTDRANRTQIFSHCVLAYKPEFRYVNGQIEYGLRCWNPTGSFSPATQSTFVISRTVLAASSAYYAACFNA